MSDAVPVLALLAIGCLIVFGSRRLGLEPSISLAGLWAPQGRTDWPHGIQEMDVPSFAVTHLDALHHGTSMSLDTPVADGSTEQDAPQPEMVELFDGPLRSDRAE